MKSVKPTQAFERFSYLPDGAQPPGSRFVDPDSRFIEITYDISRGIAMILDMVHTSQLDDEAKAAGGDYLPILGHQARENLMRFAIQSANLLREKAWENIEMLNNAERNGGLSA
jgi:hypothetical protein